MLLHGTQDLHFKISPYCAPVLGIEVWIGYEFRWREKCTIVVESIGEVGVFGAQTEIKCGLQDHLMAGCNITAIDISEKDLDFEKSSYTQLRKQ